MIELVTSSTETLIVSNFAAAEFIAALFGHVRRGTLAVQSAERLIARFERDTSSWAQREEMNADDVRFCALLVRRVEPRLRVPDALHLAICNRHEAILVSSDTEQLTAARFHGIPVLVP